MKQKSIYVSMKTHSSLKRTKRVARIYKLLFVFLFNLSSVYSIELCFEESSELLSAKNSLNEILLPGESAEKISSSCLHVKNQNYRNELIIKYLKMKHGNNFQVKNHQVIPRTCHLELEEHLKKNGRSSNYNISNKNINLVKRNDSENQVTISTLNLGENFPGKIMVDQFEVFLICKIIGKQFQIQVSLNSPNSSLSTFVTLFKGQKVSIGDVVKNLSGKDSKVEANSKEKIGLKYKKKKGKQVKQYFLSVK